MKSPTDKGKAVLTAIIDGELELDGLAEKQTERLDVAQPRLKNLARKAYNARMAGSIGRRDAKRKFIEGFVAAMLAEYAHDAPEVKGLVDRCLTDQVKLVRSLDGPLSELPAIRDTDMKARAVERASGGST